MSVFRNRMKSIQWKIVAKVMIVPFVVCAVVGADSLSRETNKKAVVQDDDGLDETLRSHFVRMDKNNSFNGVITGIDANTGKVTGIGNLNVYLVQRSNVIRQSKTDSSGSFSLSNLSPGTYSFCVAGKNGFLAYGLHLLKAEEQKPTPADKKQSSLDEDLEIHTSWVAPTTVTAAVVPPEFTALRQIMSDLLPGSVSNSVGMGKDAVRINVEKSVVAGGYKIELGDNGSLKGRIAPVGNDRSKPIRLREMNVFLIKNDEVYARATVEKDGAFEFLDVDPGVYGFAAVGKDGFAAISFEAVKTQKKDDGKDASFKSGITYRLTSLKENRAPNLLEIAICPPEDSDFLKRKIQEITDGVDPARPIDGLPGAGGPAIGGPAPGFDSPAFPSFGGGGGGFGPLFEGPGFRRLFRLGALGGIIWGIVELADDDEPLAQPAVVSPSG